MIRLLSSVIVGLCCISCSNEVTGITHETNSSAFLITNKTDTTNSELSYIGGNVMSFRFGENNLVVTSNKPISLGLHTVDIQFGMKNSPKGNLLVNDTVNGLSGAIQFGVNGEYSVVEFKNLH